MIKLADLFEEIEGENTYIIITAPATLLLEHSTQTLLNEGRWEESGIKDYWQRVDIPHFDHDFRHIHIAHQKHINAKSQQVSWNDNGTRHDRKSFNGNFTGMETAKKIARDALGLDDSVILENENKTDGMILLESVTDPVPVTSEFYVFTIKPAKVKLLKG